MTLSVVAQTLWKISPGAKLGRELGACLWEWWSLLRWARNRSRNPHHTPRINRRLYSVIGIALPVNRVSVTLFFMGKRAGKLAAVRAEMGIEEGCAKCVQLEAKLIQAERKLAQQIRVRPESERPSGVEAYEAKRLGLTKEPNWRARAEILERLLRDQQWSANDEAGASECYECGFPATGGVHDGDCELARVMGFPRE